MPTNVLLVGKGDIYQNPSPSNSSSMKELAGSAMLGGVFVTAFGIQYVLYKVYDTFYIDRVTEDVEGKTIFSGVTAVEEDVVINYVSSRYLNGTDAEINDALYDALVNLRQGTLETTLDSAEIVMLDLEEAEAVAEESAVTLIDEIDAFLEVVAEEAEIIADL